ncbi:MAG: polysaccharide biosynthesis/export family protein [Gemmatimonadetes bacterium]|nr:polysaccharide biosynthesis/export family protein [Gemmatimonadota bacterium]
MRVHLELNKPAMLLGLAGLLALSPMAGAQDPLGLQRRQATRAELEEAVKAADSVAPRVDEKTRLKLEAHANSIRQRLKNGDFGPGDRLYLTVLGDSTLTDTFTVKQEQKLALPNIPEFSVRGVLDSELTAHLTKELSRYVRDPKVTATGLIRLTLTGGVGRPGFVTVPVDMLVTDVLMSQGGPSQAADLPKAYVKRANRTHLDKKQFAEALRTGRTVGDVAIRDGDEIIVPVVSPNGRWGMTWIPVVTSVVGLFWIIQGGRGGRRINP